MCLVCDVEKANTPVYNMHNGTETLFLDKPRERERERDRLLRELMVWTNVPLVTMKMNGHIHPQPAQEPFGTNFN